MGATAQDGTAAPQVVLSLAEFKAKVLERQIRNAIRMGRRYCSNVPDGELASIEDGHRMRTAAAASCKNLLKAARARKAQREAWRGTWLFAWLTDNAAEHNLKNLETEEWHRDYNG